MESGIMDLSMGMECGRDFIMTPTSESGTIPEQTDTAYTSGKTVIDMRESGSSVSNMDRVQIYSQMVTPTLGSTLMVNLMERGATPGPKADSTKASSTKAKNTEKVNGKRTAITTKDYTPKIRNTDTVNSNGRLVMSIRETTPRMKEMGTVR